MRVLLPLPSTDFDPTECAVPWQALVAAGHEVIVATPDGRPGQVDARMVTGEGLGPWRTLLRATDEGRAAFASFEASASFRAPRRWDALHARDFDALVLPGGHAKGMRPYLESGELREVAAKLSDHGRPIGAICHGVVLAARTTSPRTGRSILDGRNVTALLATQELSAFALTCLWLGGYYRTYPETVQAEVTRAAGSFAEGPLPLLRDSAAAPERGFVVRDGPLVTARWPGDAFAFARAFVALLRERAA
jgi:protease I